MDHVWWSFMVKSWCYKNCFIWCWVTELYSGKSSWYQQSTDLVCSCNNIHKNKESLTWPCFMAIHGQHVFPWPCLTVKHGQDIFSIFFLFLSNWAGWQPINIFFTNSFDCLTVFKKIKIQYLYYKLDTDHVWWSFMVRSWYNKNYFIWCSDWTL